MSPIQFWKCTPRKFNALCAVHADLNTPEDSKKKKDKTKSSKNPDGSIGAPDTFIDEII